MTKHKIEIMDALSWMELRIIKVEKDGIMVEPSAINHSGQVFVGPRTRLYEGDIFSFGVSRRSPPAGWKLKADD